MQFKKQKKKDFLEFSLSYQLIRKDKSFGEKAFTVQIKPFFPCGSSELIVYLFPLQLAV